MNQPPSRLLPLPFHRARGLALIAVLLLVSVLSVLAVGVLGSVRRHAQLAQRSFEAVQLQEVADSALRIRLLELSEPAPGSGAPRPLGVSSTSVLGIAVVLTIGLEAGRIDLNAADRDLLVAAFAANHFSIDDAGTLAERILDWRDADDGRTSQGAERPEYQSAGRQDGPRNGPFESVSEVRRVLGLENLSDELLGAFTVYSHVASVRESAAPPVVMRALQWADSRQLGGHRWINHEIKVPQQNSAARTLAGELLRMAACIDGLEGHLCRVVVVRITGNPQTPWQVFKWETASSEASTQSVDQVVDRT